MVPRLQEETEVTTFKETSEENSNQEIQERFVSYEYLKLHIVISVWFIFEMHAW